MTNAELETVGPYPLGDYAGWIIVSMDRTSVLLESKTGNRRRVQYVGTVEMQERIDELERELKKWKPLSPDEAQKAFDEAKAAPLSEERIMEIVKRATDPGETIPNSEQMQMAVRITELERQLAESQAKCVMSERWVEKVSEVANKVFDLDGCCHWETVADNIERMARQLAAAESHCRNHHQEPCETCIACTIERDEAQRQLAEAKAENERLKEDLHLANGTADLAIKHRDMAEAELARLNPNRTDVHLESFFDAHKPE